MQPQQKSSTGSLASKLPRLNFHEPYSQYLGSSGTSTFLPLHMEQRYAYPLLIWLNNDSRTEHQLSRIMPKVSLRNYIGIAPLNQQACSLPIPSSKAHPPADFQSPTRSMDCHDILEQVFESIDKTCLQYNVDSNRIFIAGLGEGGSLALHLAFTFSEYFAGAISLGGAIPRQNSFLRDLRSNRHTPIFLSQSRDDQTYPETTLCDDLRLLHVGGFSVTARQYPGYEVLNERALHDIDVWMMEIINGYDMTAPDQFTYDRN